MRFILENLGSKPIDWLKSLPFDKQLNDDIYLCHGTPSSDLVYLLEDVELGYPCLRSDKDISKLLIEQHSDVVCCGHTHIPRAVTLNTGQLIINPGSVGLQAYTDESPVEHSMENYTPHASYGIIEKEHSGWAVQHIKVPYDVTAAVRDCTERGRKDWVHFITTGRKVV